MDSLGPRHAADPSGDGNIACYGSRLFDIQLIRKYQNIIIKVRFLNRAVHLTECAICVQCIYSKCTGVETLIEFGEKLPLAQNV